MWKVLEGRLHQEPARYRKRPLRDGHLEEQGQIPVCDLQKARLTARDEDTNDLLAEAERKRLKLQRRRRLGD